MDSFDELIHPMTVQEFFTKYWGKEHFVIKSSCGACKNWMENLYTWDDFNKYVNQYPYIRGLQILNYDDKDDRFCLDKVRSKKLDQPFFTKNQVYKFWKQGKSFVIPMAEYQKEDLVKVCGDIEMYFGLGCANVYCSPGGGSKSFPPHADSTENFLLHNYGKTKWTMYKEFAPEKPKTIIAEYELEPGDLLYIPIGQYHKAESMTPRISTSVHFHNKKNQSIKHFKIRSENREPYYNFKYFLNEDSNNK